MVLVLSLDLAVTFVSLYRVATALKAGLTPDYNQTIAEIAHHLDDGSFGALQEIFEQRTKKNKML